MHLQLVSAEITTKKKQNKTTSSQPSSIAVSYQMHKVSSQPGKCINQDLQEPNQIKWMITTTGAGSGGRRTQKKKRGTTGL